MKGTSAIPEPVQKVGKALGNAYSETDSLLRGLFFGGDMSAAGRQGAVLGVTRPRAAVRAMGDQVRAYTSPTAYDQQLRSIAARPTAQLHQDFGLYVPRAEAVANGSTMHR